MIKDLCYWIDWNFEEIVSIIICINILDIHEKAFDNNSVAASDDVALSKTKSSDKGTIFCPSYNVSCCNKYSIPIIHFLCLISVSSTSVVDKSNFRKVAESTEFCP